MKRVLVIDDDEKLGALLREYLMRFEYGVDISTHPRDGLRQLQNESYDIVILDVMLPDMNGFDVLKELRKSADIPVIMLTARGDTMDRIVGLELGADDYLPKPFEPRELLARMQTIFRRLTRAVAPVPSQRFGDLQIDFGKRVVMLSGKEVDLTTMEFDILALLVGQRGAVVSRDDIMEHLRGIDWDAYNRSVDVLVSRLRTKLSDDAKHPRFIKTIWGKGYQFVGAGGEENTRA